MKNNSIKKILIIRLGAIGDVVHSSALFRSIKKHSPEASIDYLTTKAPSMLIKHDPDLNNVWIAEKKNYSYLFKLAKELKTQNYDLIINLQPSIRTKVLSFLINPKYTLIYKKSFKLHAVENFWATAKPLFKDLKLDNNIYMYIPDEINQKISGMLPQNKKIIGFNIGTSLTRQGRKYPMSYWRKLAKAILDKYNCEIILTGSEEDKALTDNLLDISPSIKSFCGKLNILESAAILSKCDLVISCDTGPLHIATAVGAKCIGLYGAAPISRTGPYGEDHFAISSERKCVPCNRRQCKYMKKAEETSPCLFDIEPAKILNIVDASDVLN